MRERAATRDRQPAKRYRENNREQRPQPERRHRYAQQRERRRNVIDGRPRTNRRDDAQWNRNQDRHRHRGGSQFDGRRHPFGDRGRHFLVGSNRRAQISCDHAGHETAVLNVQRPIETQALSEGFDVLRRRAVAEHRLHRIAGNQMNEEEHEGGNAEEHRDGQQQAAQEEANHVRFRPVILKCPGAPSAWSDPVA